MSVAGAIISGAIGAMSQDSANRAYLEGVDKTNEQNYRIFKENQAYERQMMYEQSDVNYDLWKKQQEYNSPLAQRQRLEEAGYNPSAMLQGGNPTGVATSAPSSPTHSSVPSPVMQAPNQTTPTGVVFAQNLMQGMVAFANANKTNIEAGAIEEKLPFEVSALKDYASMQGMTKEFMKEFAKPMMQLDMAIKEGEVRRQTQSNFLQSMVQSDVIRTYQAQRILAECNAEQAITLNKYFDQQQQLQISEKINQIALLATQEKWSQQQIKLAIAQTASEWASVAFKKAQTDLFTQSWQFNEDTRDIRIAGMKQDNLLTYYQREEQQLNVGMLKGTFGSMLDNALVKYKMESAFFDSEEMSIRWNDTYFNHSIRWIGDNLRNLLGGLMGGNIGYQYQPQPKAMGRIGFVK